MAEPTDPAVECDFVRFLGRKSLDDGDDKSSLSGGGLGDNKSPVISGGQGDLQLPPEASLLVASNRFGALFAGTAQGLRWAWLADMSRECDPGGAAAAFTSIDLAGTPIAFALSADDAQLACVITASGVARLQLFDVVALLRGGRCVRVTPRPSHVQRIQSRDSSVCRTPPTWQARTRRTRPQAHGRAARTAGTHATATSPHPKTERPAVRVRLPLTPVPRAAMLCSGVRSALRGSFCWTRRVFA